MIKCFGRSPNFRIRPSHMLGIVESERWWPIMGNACQGGTGGVGSSFALLVVLFILLIIIGASYLY